MLSAVIAGASGLAGSHLLKVLLADPEIFEVIAVGRKSLGSSNPKLKEVLISDLAELPGQGEKLRGDLYFCCLGTTLKTAKTQANFRKVDYSAVVEFGKIAKANGAKAFVVISSYGANAKAPFFYARTKGEAELALTALKLRRLVIFRPSFLIGNRQEVRRGERLFIGIAKALSRVLPKAINKRMMTPVEILVDRMIAEAKAAEPGTCLVEAGQI
ncbi:MAG: NAD-dependent epimerase/dehydratase family protein [bacterium]